MDGWMGGLIVCLADWVGWLCVCVTAGHGGVWKSVSIVASTTNTVTVGGVPDSATKIRYNGHSNP